jgi:pyruvate kinase
VVAHDFDMIAASFVRKASDVAAIRAHVDVCVAERKAALGDGAVCIPPLIISKIESTEALENLDEILEASDGLMVARGDLGVEVPMAMVTLYQKEIVAKCNKVGKPVIVATQMLETMQGNPRPTRAEVADVTNAILDGADAVMLSGETANGKYPVESVATMNAIVQATEISSLAHAQPEWRAPPAAVVATDANAAAQDRDSTPTQHFEGLASAAVVAAAEIGATAIVVLTSTGRLARLVAKHRPTVPVVAFLGEAKVGRQLILHRSIHPVVAMRHEEPSQRPTRAVQHAKDMGFCAAGDRVVILLAEPETEVTKVSVTMRIAEVL